MSQHCPCSALGDARVIYECALGIGAQVLVHIGGRLLVTSKASNRHLVVEKAYYQMVVCLAKVVLTCVSERGSSSWLLRDVPVVLC